MGFKKLLRGGWTSIFRPKKQVDDGSVRERQEANTSQAMMGRETPLQPETMQPETTESETTIDQPRGHVTDTNPIVNAMFNEEVAISGGTFVQNFGEKNERHGFKLLREQAAPSAFHNSAERIDPARCHPETRVDIMQTIYDWITVSGQRDKWLLWLNGAAGAGKSAIMQSVAERCVLATIAIASFFFVRADGTRNTMAPFVATLVYQLIQEIPETSDDILLTIERNPLIFKQSLETQLRQLIIQPLRRIPPHLQRLFVVFIDGLDECNNRAHQSHLIKLLGNIVSGSNVPVIFAIASRREPQIEAEFCQEQIVNMLTTIPLDNIQASDDIRRFLNAKFKEIKATHLRRTLLSPDWPSSAVVEQIVEKSSGQFIYASVVIGYISLPHALPALQLDVINGIRPRNPSENPFAYLDALYQYIFSEVKQLDVVRNVLSFELVTDHYYTIQTVETLFQLATGELEVLFADLTAIIKISGPHNEIGMQFLHASLPDFLLDKSRSGDYYIDLDEYKPNLASIFLEIPCSTSDPHLSTSKLKDEGYLAFQERVRLGAIDKVLKQAKASNQLQRACMNFNCIIDGANMLDTYSSEISRILHCLKHLNFQDQGQAYHHVLDVFAVECAKYWFLHDKNCVSDDTKEFIIENSPDLVAHIHELRQEES